MAQRAIVRTIPAPVGGLNDINSIADMPPTDALVMDNIFPGTNSCSLRGGSVQWVSGLGAIGETLLAYNGINSKKLFVAAGTSIIDVTTGGVAGAAAIGGFSNARWDYVNFGGNAGNHLVAVNSADLPIFYNGSTWAVSGSGFATAIIGVDASLFSSVAVFKNRLYFVQKNSLKCWYLGTNSIGGTANEIDFSGVARLGGKLVAITTIPSSAGQSIDDFFCAITSEGELLVYKGTDPASVSTFALVGVYRVGRPVANGSAVEGSRFIEKMGSDMIAITIDGFTTLQSALNNDVVAQSTTINKKIVNSVTRDTGQYKQNFGWQIVLAPNNNKLLINVPTGGGEYYQYVMNTITGAWCRFTGLNASCWAYWDDQLYAVMGPVSGSGSAIYKMDVNNALGTQVITSYTKYSSYIWTRETSGVTLTNVPYLTALSDDGKYIYGTCPRTGIYKSSDYGYTWSLISAIYPATYIKCSGNGQYIVCGSVNQFFGHESESGIYISNDYGATWTQQFSTHQCQYVSMSNDGKRIVFLYDLAHPKISNDYGLTWVSCLSTGVAFTGCYDLKISGDGLNIYALFGANIELPRRVSFADAELNAWTQMSGITIGSDKRSIDINFSGSIIMICGLQHIYKSIDYGVTFLDITPVANEHYSSICCDDSGANMAICTLNTAAVYLSNDFGNTWTQTKEIIPTTGVYKATGSFESIAISNGGGKIAVQGANIPPDSASYYFYIGTGA